MNYNQISIIIVTYNAEEYITACLDSIKDQDYKNFNIIIIDNNSTDRTIDLIKKYPYKKNISIIKNDENLGFSRACNIGINYAIEKLMSHFVLLLNQDTVSQRNLLSSLLFWQKRYGDAAYCPKILIKKNKRIWWIGTQFFTISDLLKNFNLSVSYHINKEEKNNFYLGKPKEREAITGCALFLSRKLIKNVGLFDEHFFMYGEDLDYSIRMKKKGYKLFLIPGTTVFHDVELEEIALSNDKKRKEVITRYIRHFKSSLLLMYKHFSLFYMAVWVLRVPFSIIYEINKRSSFIKK